MKYQAFISFLLLLLASGWTDALAQTYAKARLLTVDNGLSDNRVSCFYKDRNGFIWAGTRNGLNQYDGHAFRVFRPAAGNSVSNEIINAITGDSMGNLWVATMHGLNKYDPLTNHWETILPNALKKPAGLPNSLVWDIQTSKNGLLWIASDVFEFSSFNPASGEFTYYDWPGFAKTLPEIKGSHYKAIQKFLPKSAHEFWLATNRGLVILNILTRQFTLAGTGYLGTVRGLAYDSVNRKVFVSVDKDRCFVFDETKKKFTQISLRPEDFPSTSLTDAVAKGEWLPASAGLLKIMPGTGLVSIAKHIPGFAASLPPGAVNAVFTDNQGLRWVGTDNGIALYDPLPGATFIPLLQRGQNAPVTVMGSAIFDTASNSYFVCSLQPAAVFIIPADGRPIIKIIADKTKERFTACNTICQDKEGIIWLLTDNHVYQFSRAGLYFSKFPVPNRGADVGFRSFARDEAGNYWFGTYLDGIFYFDKNKQQFVAIHFPFLPFTKKIGCLRLDTLRHCMWISAYASDVIKFDLRNFATEGFEDQPGLSALNLVNDILIDRRGNTWMATSGSGVVQFPPQYPPGIHCSWIDMKSGLPENSFVSMCEDQTGNIWLLSERGFVLIDSTGKQVPTGYGTPSFGFSTYTTDTRSPHSIFFNRPGLELVAAVEGGLYRQSAKNSHVAYPFNVVITGTFIEKQNGTAGPASYVPGQQLPYHTNSLRFEFAGLYYGPPQGIYYEHRLQGYDGQWRASADFTAGYQNLPPGKYQFQVRARYPDDTIAGTSATVYFAITPPFWKTIWFILLVLLMAAVLLRLLVNNLLQKLKAEKMLNAFSISLYGQNTIEEICRDIAKNCVDHLGFTDCVMYEYQQAREMLIRLAAYRQKNTLNGNIHHRMAIAYGKELVGQVAMHAKMEIIRDGSGDTRRLADDERWMSAMAVPVFIDQKLFGVLGSKNIQKNFYSRFHRKMLPKIAALCAQRIARYQAGEQMRGKIARDLHDEMGSTLTSINIMSKVAMEGDTGQVKTHEYLQKIKDHSRRMLESIGDMVWVIDPSNDNFEKLQFRMKEFTAEILEPAGILYEFTEQGALHTIQLGLEQRKEIYLVFKEAITNAVKYSGAGEIGINLAATAVTLEIRVEDKGRGFDSGSAGNGNGLRNMRERAASIGAIINISSQLNQGTVVQMQLPLTLSGYNHAPIKANFAELLKMFFMETGIILYEDNASLRESLQHLLKLSGEFRVLGAYENCSNIITDVQALRPDVILMDIDLPGISGIEGVKIIRRSNRQVQIIMLTVFDDNTHVFDALFAGANGYLLKKYSSDKLTGAIREVLQGGAPMSPSIARIVIAHIQQDAAVKDYQLTAREKEILQSLSKGNSFKRIAAELDISIETVRTHIKHIYDKLHVQSQIEAVSKAFTEKLI